MHGANKHCEQTEFFSTLYSNSSFKTASNDICNLSVHISLGKLNRCQSLLLVDSILLQNTGTDNKTESHVHDLIHQLLIDRGVANSLHPCALIFTRKIENG